MKVTYLFLISTKCTKCPKWVRLGRKACFHLSLPLCHFKEQNHTGGICVELYYIFRLNCGEGNGTPLQYACLENPGDGGAWWLQSMGSWRVGHDWVTSLSLFLPCIGEGNGNPLQCSCLENPRDGGAWWAAVYGVAQSRTRLKWLSSSSTLNCHAKICVFNFSLFLSLSPILLLF